MTRVGKIARLPRLIREQLNRRLEDGEPGVEALAWLNALPEVLTVLEKDFAGRPISVQNLSEWKPRTKNQEHRLTQLFRKRICRTCEPSSGG